MSAQYNFNTLAGQIEAAFDYRGDVTVTLTDGSTFEGFVFNRSFNNGAGFVELYPQDKTAKPVRFEVGTITSITLTGEDTAAGKSWEEWQEKKRATA